MTRRHVTQQTCKTCHAPILTGLDNDTAGLPTHVDPQPVDNLGEAVAVLTGRRTYDLRQGSYEEGRGGRLEQRTASSIRTSHRLHPVHAEHRCDQPLPAAAPSPGRGWATGTEF